MAKRVSWKKGMRLSTDVFNASDNTAYDALRQALMATANGRMGLYTTDQPFELSVNVTGNTLEVVSLSCHGITRSGQLIDINFDSSYNNTFDTRLNIPTGTDGVYILTVKMHPGQWRDVNDTLAEELYTFELIAENSAIDRDSLPIGQIVYQQYGWRLNDLDYCPPCLFVGAHRMYQDLTNRALTLSKNIEDKCMAGYACNARNAVHAIWTAASTMRIRLDKERVTLTPNALYAELQSLISAFVIGTSIDRNVNLMNPEPFVNYTQAPYDLKNLYRDIDRGLNLCAEISMKLDAICSDVEPEPRQAPTPPPTPAPRTEPQRPSRRGWDGRVI